MTASRTSANGIHVDPSTLAADLPVLRAEVQRRGAVAQQDQAPQSSVQIEQAAKPSQPPRVTVKVYAPMPAAAAAMAQQLYDTRWWRATRPRRPRHDLPGLAVRHGPASWRAGAPLLPRDRGQLTFPLTFRQIVRVPLLRFGGGTLHLLGDLVVAQHLP